MATEETFTIGVSTIQRLDALLHEAQRWATSQRMEDVLEECIVLLRSTIYPVPELKGDGHDD